MAATMPTGIGRVLLSSGYTMWNNRVADWAFVQMFDNVTPQPFTFPKIPSSQNPSKFKLGLNYNEGAPLAGFGDLKANEWYCKVGKPTGLIGGICKGVQVPCCWNAVGSVHYDMSGKRSYCRPKNHRGIRDCGPGGRLHTDRPL